ncbi:hypothetical protein BDV97DRAFT_364626 [Delphinella strobiligena]|nr:hypothetical protein BDV97DRAFT_364626 [Delphinella strobiligena]
MSVHGKQATVFVLVLVLLILSFISIVLRCFARISIRGFGWDDWLMVTAFILFAASVVPMYYCILAALGVEEKYLTAQNKSAANHAYVAWEPLYIWCLIFIKASICFTFLRIAEGKAIVRIIWAVLALSTISGIITFIASLNICHPLSHAWDPKPGGFCKDGSFVANLAYFISATSIVTDFTCAILPIFILWGVRIEKRLKMTIAAVLGMGFVASSATLVCLRYLGDYTTTVEYRYKVSDLAIWSMVECALGIIAGSASTYKPLVRKMFDKFGSSLGSSGRKEGLHQYGLRDLTVPTGKSYNIKVSSGRRGVNQDDNESQKDMITNEGITVNRELNVEEEYDLNYDGSPKQLHKVFEERCRGFSGLLR